MNSDCKPWWAGFVGAGTRSRRIAGWVAVLLISAGAAPAFGQAGPQLVSVTPAQDSLEVPTNSVIVFVFDQEMNTAALPFASIPGVFVGNFEVLPGNLSFTGSWGADKRTLTLQSGAALPTETVIQWTLNPPGGTIFPPLASAAGEVVETISGNFTTAAGVPVGPTPEIVSVNPALGAEEVSPNHELVFTFDLPMDTSVALVNASLPGGNYQFTPVHIAFQFQASWSEDGRQLRFVPSGPIAANTLVTWTLNPGGASAPLRSAVGQPLETVSGSYRVLANTGGNPGETCTPPFNTDGSFGLFKTIAYQQTSAAGPELLGASPIVFNSFVQNRDATGVSTVSASLMFPNGTSGALTNQIQSGDYYFWEHPMSEEAMEAEFPPGAYTLEFEQSSGEGYAIEMMMPPLFVSVPTVANWEEAQEIDATQSFTLDWQVFAPLPADGFINITIVDEFGNLMFGAPNECVGRELSADATSVVIPANYLKPGRSYTAALIFGVNFYFSTNAVPEMVGTGSILKQTLITLKTSGGGGTGPSAANIVGWQLLENGNPALTIAGSAGETYRVERASAVSASWSEAGLIEMGAAGEADFEDTNISAFPVFYRVVFEEP